MTTSDSSHPSTASTRTGRRFFLPIAVHAPGGNLRALSGVERDLERMTALFSRLGYDLVPMRSNPSAAELGSAFKDWLGRVDLGRGDAVTVYYSGHGTVAGGDHYLCTAGFAPEEPAATGFKTQDLVELTLRRTARPGQLWLILDCCQAGDVLCAGLCRALTAGETATFILAAGGSFGQVPDGSFSEAFQQAVFEAVQVSGSRVSLDQLTQRINERRPVPGAVQVSLSSSSFDLLDAKRPQSTTFS